MKNIKKTNLIIIDPQNDFCDPKGSLFVNGADQDMIRISKMIKGIKDSIDNIYITLDNHPEKHIAHGCFWVDVNGKEVKPFTKITLEDFNDGLYRTKEYCNNSHALEYLEKEGYIFIWPTHCVHNTWGRQVNYELTNALALYTKNGKHIHYIEKGMNPFTEQFSAIKAAVPYDGDASTQLNISFLDKIRDYDINLFCGEASSHCVKETIKHIIKYSSKEVIESLVVVYDGMSCVPSFEEETQEFFNIISNKGVHFLKANEVELYLR